jgi:uncharacterized membrane protein
MERNEKPSEETLEQWHKDPNNWRLGIFYFNKQDKRIFPPKKIKAFGWTVNFANPLSILTIIGITIVVLLIQRFVFKH